MKFQLSEFTKNFLNNRLNPPSGRLLKNCVSQSRLDAIITILRSSKNQRAGFYSHIDSRRLKRRDELDHFGLDLPQAGDALLGHSFDQLCVALPLSRLRLEALRQV